MYFSIKFRHPNLTYFVIGQNHQSILINNELSWYLLNLNIKIKILAMKPGLGRVPDLQVWVQVRVLAISVSTSTSMSTWLLHEYKSEYEYWLMSRSTSTSTGLWSTFYIGSRFLLFGLWHESPQILKNLGQSSSCPLSLNIFVNLIYICLIILCNLIQWHFNLRFAMYWLLWLTLATCCQFKNRKQKLCNIMKCMENSVFL